jgi:hypothetical protein
MADVRDATDLVVQMKEAVRQLVSESAGTKDSPVISSLELELEGVVTTDLGGDLKFKIFGHELGLRGERDEKQLQKISVSLVPDLSEQREDLQTPSVSQVLYDALRTIRDTAAFAAQEEPKYKLENGTAELNFEVTADGSFNFFVEAERESVATQTARIKMKAGE